MAPPEAHVFSANPTRAFLTLGGTVGLVAGGCFVFGNLRGALLMAAGLTAVWAVGMYQQALTHVRVYQDRVELDYRAWRGSKPTVSLSRSAVAGEYKQKAGPKGILLTVLELKNRHTGETLAQVQGDLTGWKEADLVALSTLLGPA